MLQLRNPPTDWPWLILGLFIAYLVLWLLKFVRHRRFYANLPSPSHSLLWGNIHTLGNWVKNFPPNAYPHAMMADIVEKYGFRGLYYVDVYPFADPVVFIIDPSVEIQTRRFERHPTTKKYLRGLAGSKGLFSAEGLLWQSQRSWFSPAFSQSNITTLVAGMMEETLIFKKRLTALAISGEKFSLLEVVTPLTIDIIVRSVLGTRLQSQTRQNSIAQEFYSIIHWVAGDYQGILKKWIGPLMMDWHTTKLNRLLRKAIKEQCAAKVDDKPEKVILDLALQGYQKEHGKQANTGPISLDEEFMHIALDNAKNFITGGHDTTAGMITYAYHLLSTHPEVLRRVRNEHDMVFSTTSQATIDALSDDPHLLSKLPLTLAVLKETLRLYPVGFVTKIAPPGSSITFEGRSYPVGNHIVCINSSFMQRDVRYWSEPAKFMPDRFLVPLDRTQNDAYMPFSKGPLNCIGRQLALTEAQVVMVLTLRFFDFEPIYASDAPAIPGWGGKAYQELKLGAKPKDGIPMKVRLRENVGKSNRRSSLHS